MIAYRHSPLEQHARLEDHGRVAQEAQAERLVDDACLAEAALRVVVEVLRDKGLGTHLYNTFILLLYISLSNIYITVLYR